MSPPAEHAWRADPVAAVSSATVVIVPPLFEEANRMRRTLAMAGRALATRGVAAAIPDLPGQNESLFPGETADLKLWRSALAEFAASLPGPVVTASVRGGALIDDGASAAAHWRLNAVAGAPLLRAMMRTRIAGAREAGQDLTIDALRESARLAPVELAGNFLSPAMVADLEMATPAETGAPLRTVTAGGDGEDRIAGAALWLRAEPGEDPVLAQAIADDIVNWMGTCGLI
jgi:hypothetical protein